MKRIHYILYLAILFVAISCNNYPIPEPQKPEFSLQEGDELISIEALKLRHTVGNTPTYIADNVYIKGIVTGDDESGNIYKSIYIQDETGGLNLAIDQVNLYNHMPRGQEVYVRLQGMFIGDYNNMYQLGDTVTDEVYGLEMSRYDWSNEYRTDSLGNSTKHFFCNGWPDINKVPAPIEITSSAEITSDMYGMLVTLKNITFKDAVSGILPWSISEQTVNRTATFLKDGSTIIVRTSGYSNFYADYIPLGTGEITGILALFGTTQKFYLRDRNDIGTFIEQ